MNITTFDGDLLNLRSFAERLQRFIGVEDQFVQGSLVLALSSKFGSGKTTFLQMWKAELERQKEEQSTSLVISLNAWESDYYGDPLFAIVSGLVDAIRKQGSSADAIVEAAKDIGWFAVALGGQVVQKMTGIDAVAAGGLAHDKKAKRDNSQQVPKDTFSAYQGRKNAMGHLKMAVQDFVNSTEPRVLFLVDELDRCRPDYAISYLETIKHIFDIQGAVFILAADRKQLENSAKTAFGAGLDFEEYYRKFVHREITLPPISDAGYSRLATTYVTHYLQREGLRKCFMALDHDRKENISELLAALKLTPRQMQEVFRILGHMFATSEDREGRLRWCLAVGSIAMAGFKVGNPRVFHLLGTQQFEPDEALRLLTDLFGDRRVEWWFTLLLTGGGLKMNEGETADAVMAKVGLADPRQLSHLGQWHEACWDSSGSRLEQIHGMIEQVLQWE